MRRISIIIAITILIISLSGCSNVNFENSISVENLNKHIDVLTSTELQGRLMGTEGNKKAIDYISNQFSEIGLEPVIGDSYTQIYKGLNVTYESTPVFKVIDNSGNTVESFSEGIDYKIRLDNNAMTGNFKGNAQYIDHKNNILRNEFKYDNLAVLLDYNNKSVQETYLSESEIDDRIFYKGAKMLIYTEYNDVNKKDIQLGTKNSWGISSGPIKLGMEPGAFERLVSYSEQGYGLEVNIPIVFNEVESSNVLGMISGKVKDYNNVIIATSFDGLGMDSNGSMYSGTVDNATSVALFLELSRALKEQADSLDSNIILLALNGNKLGDRGFDNFFRIEDISPVRSQVIYLDKIGTVNGDLNVGTFTSQSTEYKLNNLKFNEILKTIKDMDISVNEQIGYFASDYTNFRFRGIPALVLTNGENENIGTLNDTKDNMDIKKIVEVGDIVFNHVNIVGRINIFKELIGLFKSIWVLVLVGILLIFIKFGLYEKRRSLRDRMEPAPYIQNKFKKFMEKPIVSLYLIFMFYAIIMIIQAKHRILLTEGIINSDINIDYIAISYAIINNILSTGPMLAFISFFVAPLLLVIVGIRLLSEKYKISNKINFLIVGISSYVAMLFSFRMFYNYDYAVIFPKLLSLPNSYFVVILMIIIYSIMIVYFLNKELKDFTLFKWIIAFLIIFILFVSITYSPYLFNKTVINLRNSGGRIRL